MIPPLPAGTLILTPNDARILYQVAKIKDLRTRYRIGDTRTYELLTAITVSAFQTATENGNLDRQEAAREHTGFKTVQQLATASGLSPRTVRLDCLTGELPAIKEGRSWLIADSDAATYVQRRKRR